jgi:hypothetical protein
MTFGENHVLEQDDTTTKDNNSDFWRVLVGLNFDNVFGFEFVDGF